MRVSARVALVSVIIASSGFAGCGSLSLLSDTTSERSVLPEYASAEIKPGAETSESSAKEGESKAQIADTASEKKDKAAQKPRRSRTAKVVHVKKPAAPARAAAAQPQTPEPKSVPSQGEPLQQPWPTAPTDGTFSR